MHSSSRQGAAQPATGAGRQEVLCIIVTEQSLADAAGIHVQQIKRYEAGSSQPTAEALKKLALSLRVATDALLFEENERGPDEALKLQFEATRQDAEEGEAGAPGADRRDDFEVRSEVLVLARRQLSRRPKPKARKPVAEDAKLTYHFDWDPAKAKSNLADHKVSFQLAATVFRDPLALTLFDEAHSENEERWATLGAAENGQYLVVIHTFQQTSSTEVHIRPISARTATRREIEDYEETPR